MIGNGSIVAGGAVVPEGRIFPPYSVIAGVPARVIAERDSTRANRMNAWLYHRNAQASREGDQRAWEGAEFEAWSAAKQAEIDEDLDLDARAPAGAFEPWLRRPRISRAHPPPARRCRGTAGPPPPRWLPGSPPRSAARSPQEIRAPLAM